MSASLSTIHCANWEERESSHGQIEKSGFIYVSHVCPYIRHSLILTQESMTLPCRLEAGEGITWKGPLVVGA